MKMTVIISNFLKGQEYYGEGSAMSSRRSFSRYSSPVQKMTAASGSLRFCVNWSVGNIGTIKTS